MECKEPPNCAMWKGSIQAKVERIYVDTTRLDTDLRELEEKISSKIIKALWWSVTTLCAIILGIASFIVKIKLVQ